MKPLPSKRLRAQRRIRVLLLLSLLLLIGGRLILHGYLQPPLLEAECVAVVVVCEDASHKRADLIACLLLDPQTSRAAILRIPRDIYVRRGRAMLRVNALHARKELVPWIAATLDMPVQRTITLDFADAAALIDALGGIQVDVGPHPLGLYEDRAAGLRIGGWGPGVTTLNGRQAVAFARYRGVKGHKLSDTWRVNNQQKVEQAVMQKLGTLWRSPGRIWKVKQLWETRVRTNLTDREMLAIGLRLRDARHAEDMFRRETLPCSPAGSGLNLDKPRLSLLMARLHSWLRADSAHVFLLVRYVTATQTQQIEPPLLSAGIHPVFVRDPSLASGIFLRAPLGQGKKLAALLLRQNIRAQVHETPEQDPTLLYNP